MILGRLTMESRKGCLTSIKNIEEVKVEMQRKQKIFKKLVDIESQGK